MLHGHIEAFAVLEVAADVLEEEQQQLSGPQTGLTAAPSAGSVTTELTAKTSKTGKRLQIAVASLPRRVQV